ncbi:Phage tail sheath protein [compost metagenome]
MAVEFHGARATEIPFSPSSIKPQAFTLPIFVGTAPVTLATREGNAVNVPFLIETMEQAKYYLGYSEDWANFNLCEAMFSHFVVYGQSPAIFVNVLNPATHKTAVAAENYTIVNGVVTVTKSGIVPGSVVVKSADGTTTYVVEDDYEVTTDQNGNTLIGVVTGGAIPSNATALSVAFDVLDGSKVTDAEYIGGYNQTTGARTGLELTDEVFPRYQLIPNLIVIPGKSENPVIAKAMVSKAKSINGLFRARALTDVDSSKRYLELIEWKEENGFTDPFQINTYPKFKKDGRIYHASTHVAGAICAIDAINRAIPYQSPSNTPLLVDGTVDKDGNDMFLPYDQASELNRYGIVTGINFTGGFKVWGNRTGGYPDVKDPQQSFIPVARMFDWIMNTLVTTAWEDVDAPLNRRLADYVLDKVNFWMNGLVSGGALLGGRVEFVETDNTDDDLMNGKMTFRVYITPPSPAQEINFLVQYDESYLSTLTA